MAFAAGLNQKRLLGLSRICGVMDIKRSEAGEKGHPNVFFVKKKNKDSF